MRVGIVCRLDWRGERRYCRAGPGFAAGGNNHCYGYTGQEGNPCTPTTLTVGNTGTVSVRGHCESCFHAGIGDSVGGCASGFYCSFISGMSNRCLKSSNARGGAQCFNNAHCASGNCADWVGAGKRRFCYPLNGERCDYWTDQNVGQGIPATAAGDCHCSAGHHCSPVSQHHESAGIWGCGGGNWCSGGALHGRRVSPFHGNAAGDSDPAAWMLLAHNMSTNGHNWDTDGRPTRA